MAAESPIDHVQWSTTSYSIREFIHNYEQQFPIIALVKSVGFSSNGGAYQLTDSEFVVVGQILRIESATPGQKRLVVKVAQQNITLDIPLDCPVKFDIPQRNKKKLKLKKIISSPKYEFPLVVEASNKYYEYFKKTGAKAVGDVKRKSVKMMFERIKEERFLKTNIIDKGVMNPLVTFLSTELPLELVAACGFDDSQPDHGIWDDVRKLYRLVPPATKSKSNVKQKKKSPADNQLIVGPGLYILTQAVESNNNKKLRSESEENKSESLPADVIGVADTDADREIIQQHPEAGTAAEARAATPTEPETSQEKADHARDDSMAGTARARVEDDNDRQNGHVVSQPNASEIINAGTKREAKAGKSSETKRISGSEETVAEITNQKDQGKDEDANKRPVITSLQQTLHPPRRDEERSIIVQDAELVTDANERSLKTSIDKIRRESIKGEEEEEKDQNDNQRKQQGRGTKESQPKPIALDDDRMLEADENLSLVKQRVPERSKSPEYAADAKENRDQTSPFSEPQRPTPTPRTTVISPQPPKKQEFVTEMVLGSTGVFRVELLPQTPGAIEILNLNEEEGTRNKNLNLISDEEDDAVDGMRMPQMRQSAVVSSVDDSAMPGRRRGESSANESKKALQNDTLEEFTFDESHLVHAKQRQDRREGTMAERMYSPKPNTRFQMQSPDTPASPRTPAGITQTRGFEGNTAAYPWTDSQSGGNRNTGEASTQTTFEPSSYMEKTDRDSVKLERTFFPDGRSTKMTIHLLNAEKDFDRNDGIQLVRKDSFIQKIILDDNEDSSFTITSFRPAPDDPPGSKTIPNRISSFRDEDHASLHYSHTLPRTLVTSTPVKPKLQQDNIHHHMVSLAVPPYSAESFHAIRQATDVALSPAPLSSHIQHSAVYSPKRIEHFGRHQSEEGPDGRFFFNENIIDQQQRPYHGQLAFMSTPNLTMKPHADQQFYRKTDKGLRAIRHIRDERPTEMQVRENRIVSSSGKDPRLKEENRGGGRRREVADESSTWMLEKRGYEVVDTAPMTRGISVSIIGSNGDLRSGKPNSIGRSRTSVEDSRRRVLSEGGTLLNNTEIEQSNNTLRRRIEQIQRSKTLDTVRNTSTDDRPTRKLYQTQNLDVGMRETARDSRVDGRIQNDDPFFRTNLIPRRQSKPIRQPSKSQRTPESSEFKESVGLRTQGYRPINSRPIGLPAAEETDQRSAYKKVGVHKKGRESFHQHDNIDRETQGQDFISRENINYEEITKDEALSNHLNHRTMFDHLFDDHSKSRAVRRAISGASHPRTPERTIQESLNRDNRYDVTTRRTDETNHHSYLNVRIPERNQKSSLTVEQESRPRKDIPDDDYRRQAKPKSPGVEEYRKAKEEAFQTGNFRTPSINVRMKRRATDKESRHRDRNFESRQEITHEQRERGTRQPPSAFDAQNNEVLLTDRSLHVQMKPANVGRSFENLPRTFDPHFRDQKVANKRVAAQQRTGTDGVRHLSASESFLVAAGAEPPHIRNQKVTSNRLAVRKLKRRNKQIPADDELIYPVDMTVRKSIEDLDVYLKEQDPDARSIASSQFTEQHELLIHHEPPGMSNF